MQPIFHQCDKRVQLIDGGRGERRDPIPHCQQGAVRGWIMGSRPNLHSSIDHVNTLATGGGTRLG